MNGPLYPAARAFAPRLEEHFARHGAKRPPGSPVPPPLPDAPAIEALINAGFWASLQREEGHSPEISLAYLPPREAVRPLLFARPLPLGPRALVRLAPAVERPGIHLGVWREGGDLHVWGTTRVLPTLCFVLEVLGPGLLVVKHRLREESAKFRNVAVFEGEEVKLLRQDPSDASDYPALFGALFGSEATAGEDDGVEVLLRLAVSMRAHRRGGTLLVVPAGTDAWRRSIVQPIAYAVEPAFTELADVLRDPDDGHLGLARVVDAVAGLTAVDGATLITDRYELLAFGVKITQPEGRPRVEEVVLSEPVEGGEPAVVAPVQLGGTRHISAAQFAQDQEDAVAMVASQDGHFTVFAWCGADRRVHAHRVEALLL
jgi:hypothetical protein